MTIVLPCELLGNVSLKKSFRRVLPLPRWSRISAGEHCGVFVPGLCPTLRWPRTRDRFVIRTVGLGAGISTLPVESRVRCGPQRMAGPCHEAAWAHARLDSALLSVPGRGRGPCRSAIVCRVAVRGCDLSRASLPSPEGLTVYKCQVVVLSDAHLLDLCTIASSHES